MGFLRSKRGQEHMKGIERLRAIKKGHLANNETGVLNEIVFAADLFDKVA